MYGKNELNICGNNGGPDSRDLFLKRAKECFESDEVTASVIFQTKALSAGFDSRYHFNEADIGAACLRSSVKSNSKASQRNSLVNYAFNYVNEHQKNKSSARLSDNNLITSSIKEAEIQIKKICKDLPSEWSIVQVCRCHDDITTISNFFDDLSSHRDIFVSILKHSRSLEYPDPICVKIKINPSSKLYQDFGTLSKEFKEYSSYDMDKVHTSEDKENFWKGMDILENKIKDLIQRFKDEIGPWMFLLAGNFQIRSLQVQNKIYARIDKFCEENEMHDSQRVLISLLAPMITKLSAVMFKAACEYIAGDVKCLSNEIHDLLLNFEKHFKKVTFLPCLLIVDEKLDHFCWEILNEDQDFCRISSFYTLVKLFEKHKSEIKNGYITKTVKTGSCVVNPEKNLSNMEKRMNKFFDYWLTDWDCTYGVIPTQNSLLNILSSSDCYVYCGHGCGLQYINGHKFSQIEINSVVFLFGCNSVRMRSSGLHSEMMASHIYYHAALCPAVVGTILIGLDFQMDSIATRILSSWIKSDAATHWNAVNMNTWRKGSITFLVDSKKPIHPSYDQSLPSVVTKSRNWKSLKLYNRIGFVYRGLPVWNEA